MTVSDSRHTLSRSGREGQGYLHRHASPGLESAGVGWEKCHERWVCGGDGPLMGDSNCQCPRLPPPAL